MRLYEISYFQRTIFTLMYRAILITPYHQYCRSLLPLFKADKRFPEFNMSFNDQHKIIII